MLAVWLPLPKELKLGLLLGAVAKVWRCCQVAVKVLGKNCWPVAHGFDEQLPSGPPGHGGPLSSMRLRPGVCVS